MTNAANESPDSSKREGTDGKWAELFKIGALCGLVIACAIVFCVAFLKWIPDWIRYEYGPDVFTSVFHPTRTGQIKKLRLELATSQHEMDLREGELSKLRDDTEVGKKVKENFPGAYDDLSDEEVGRALKIKHAGAYDQFILDSHPHAASLEEQILKLRVAIYSVELQLKELGAEPPSYIPPNPFDPDGSLRRSTPGK